MAFDRWNRYLILPEGGGDAVPHTRATTMASTVEDRYNLELWGKRTVALGLSRRPDLFAAVAAAKDDDSKRLDALCEGALEAGGSSKGANLGQALHEFCARVDLGEDVDVPAPWDSDIKAYRKALDGAGFEVELVERTCVVPELQVAGTLDRTLLRDGRRYLGDIKTGKDLKFSWPSIACQLAIYSRATTLYDPETDTHSPMPEVDPYVGVVVHVPAGTGAAELFGVDLEAGWRGALLAGQVRQWRKDGFRIGVDSDPEKHRTRQKRGWVIGRVRMLVDHYPDDAARLAQRWPSGVPTLKQSEEHTLEQLDAIAVVLDKVEGEARLPFSDLDPTRNTQINNTERKSA